MTTVNHYSLAGGEAGTIEDLQHMAALIDGAAGNPLVVQFARTLAVNAGVRDAFRQALAIREFLSRVWRFVEDPLGRELLRDPEHMIREYQATGMITGDCDEVAILGGALGYVVGIPVQLVALGFAETRDQFTHVYAALRPDLTTGGGCVTLDVSRPAAPVPPPTQMMIVDVM